MSKLTEKLILQHAEQLEKINGQRRAWLYASSIVVLGVIFVIFSWDWLDHFHTNQVWWLVASVMLVLSVNWWYWTMRVIRVLLVHQKIEYSLLHDIITDIQLVKEDIKSLAPKTIDHSK